MTSSVKITFDLDGILAENFNDLFPVGLHNSSITIVKLGRGNTQTSLTFSIDGDGNCSFVECSIDD